MLKESFSEFTPPPRNFIYPFFQSFMNVATTILFNLLTVVVVTAKHRK